MELKSFFSPYNLYWRFISNFGRIAAPLSVKLKKWEPKPLDNLSNEDMYGLRKLEQNL